MDTQTFIIKSPFVQDAIMLFSLALVGVFLLHSLVKKKPKHTVVFCIWIAIVFWFFNSPFFGFSTVTVNPQGIEVEYGVLSFKSGMLPIDSPWKIETRLGGIKKMKKLYFIRIADRNSMKVSGRKGYALLRGIGEGIERAKLRRNRVRDRPSGDPSPVTWAAPGRMQNG